MFYSYKNRKNNVIDSMFPKEIKIGYAMYKEACIKNKRKNSKKNPLQKCSVILRFYYKP